MEACYMRPARDEDDLEHQFHRLTLELWAERPLPDAATAALPGSPEKIAILTARAEAGIQLHHPDDVLLLGYVKACPNKKGGGLAGPKWRADGTLRGVTLLFGQFRAQAQVDGESHYLGHHDTRADAEAVLLAFYRERGFDVPERPLPGPETTPRGWKGWKARQRAS